MTVMLHTVAKALDVLSVINANPGLTVNQVSVMMRIPPTTMKNLVHTFSKLNYVTEIGKPTRLFLSSKSRRLANLDDLSCAHQEIVKRVHEASTGVDWPVLYLRPLGQYMEILFSDAGKKPLAIERPKVGGKVPIIESASGAAYLAAQKSEVHRVTKTNTSSHSSFLSWVSQTTRKGFCVNDLSKSQESVLAIPMNVGGQPVGALALRFIRSAVNTEKRTHALAVELMQLRSKVGWDQVGNYTSDAMQCERGGAGTFRALNLDRLGFAAESKGSIG